MIQRFIVIVNREFLFNYKDFRRSFKKIRSPCVADAKLSISQRFHAGVRCEKLRTAPSFVQIGKLRNSREPSPFGHFVHCVIFTLDYSFS